MNRKISTNEKDEMINILNSIKIALYLIAVIFLVNTIAMVVNTNELRSWSNNLAETNENTESDNNDEILEYDVSKFKAINYDEFKKTIKSKEEVVIYIGRESCSYCAMFVPVMVEAQEKYGFETYYFDITQVFDFTNNKVIDQTAYDEFLEYDEFFEENFLATPMVAIFKNGKFVNGTLGYQEIETYSTFLEENNFKESK